MTAKSEHYVCSYCGRGYMAPPNARTIPPRRFCSRRCAKESQVIPIDQKLWARVVKSDGCWEWTGPRTPFGHGHLNHRNKRVYAHRLSWELHNGPIPDGMSVCHRCDNPPCVNPAHLWLGSHGDNLRDMATKGRQGLHLAPAKAVRGEAHHRSVLTDDMVREIRASSESAHALSRRLGVSRPTVARVRQGRTWKHVA